MKKHPEEAVSLIPIAPAPFEGEHALVRVRLQFKGHMPAKYAVNQLIDLLNRDESIVPGAKIRLRFALAYEREGETYFTVYVRYAG